MKRILLFVTLMLIIALARASVFKCETSAGFIYSEQPCPKNAKELSFRTVKPAEISSPETGSSSDKLMQRMKSESRARKANNDAREEAAEKNAATERKYKCAQARQRLDIYQQPVRVYKEDRNGERTYVDDDARASIIENAKREVESNCD